MFIPAFSWYSSAQGLKSSSRGYYNSEWMMGNLGFNKAVCVSDYVQLNSTRILGCEIGLIYELKYSGIIPNTTNMKDANLPFGYCGNPNSVGDSSSTNYIPGVDTCTDTYLSS